MIGGHHRTTALVDPPFLSPRSASSSLPTYPKNPGCCLHLPLDHHELLPRRDGTRARERRRPRRRQDFNGTSLFVAGPAQSTAGVLSFPDIFGVDSGCIKQDAEALGKLGYAVVVVDLTGGDWIVDPSDAPRKAAWLEKHAFVGTTGKRLRDAIEYLQKEVGVAAISSYGYCWGAYIGAAQSATAEPVLKGHVSFHPSWRVADSVSGEGGVEKVAEQITVPQLLLSAVNDPENVREGGSVQRILKAKAGVVGELSDVVDFPDVVHGWVNRGDLADETVKKSVMKAWHAAVKFTQTVNPL